MEAFLHGLFLAFGLIVPLGAQNVFVFYQGAVQPRWIRALPVVVTASLCDTFLILLAVLGISLVVLTFSWLKSLLFGVGICFLLVMGWQTWKQPPRESGEPQDAFSPMRQIAFAASVSLLNPHAILDTIGVIGTSSIQYTGSSKWAFTAACILVSWLWFFALAVAGRMLGKMDRSGRWLRATNRLSALIIWGAACYLARLWWASW